MSRTGMFHGPMRLLASSDASPHGTRHPIQNAPHPATTRVSCFTLEVFLTDRHLPYRHLRRRRRACAELQAEVRRWHARSPALTSLRLRLTRKPELEWLGLRWPSSLAPLLRCPGRPARRPRARHGVLGYLTVYPHR